MTTPMIVDRETVYLALFAKVQGLLAPGAVPAVPGEDPIAGTPTIEQPFNLVSRETIEVQRVEPGLQPVLFMDEAIEDYVSGGPGLYHHRWTIYFHVGCCSEKGTAVATILNPLLDVLELALAPDSNDNLLGLGDSLAFAQLAGPSIKNLGQNSLQSVYRQAVAYVPFEIIFG